MANSIKIILVFIIGIVVGIFINKLVLRDTPKIEYIKEEQVEGTVYTSGLTVGDRLVEFKTDIKALPEVFWITHTDTINDVIIQEVDTAKIIEDFLLERQYDLTLFDDDKGKLDIRPVVQYNKLQKVDYSFTPIHQRVTIKEKRLFTPFVSSNISTFNIVGLGGGLFIKDLGFEYNYLLNTKSMETGHSLGFKYKF